MIPEVVLPLGRTCIQVWYAFPIIKRRIIPCTLDLLPKSIWPHFLLSFLNIRDPRNFHHSLAPHLIHLILVQIALWIRLRLYGYLLDEGYSVFNRYNALSSRIHCVGQLLLFLQRFHSSPLKRFSNVGRIVFFRVDSVFQIWLYSHSRCFLHYQNNLLSLKFD